MTFDKQTLWRAIDGVAQRKGISVSRLFLLIGLTHYTRKRREQWPSTETIASVLAFSGLTLTQFQYLGQANNHGRYVDDNRPL